MYKTDRTGRAIREASGKARVPERSPSTAGQVDDGKGLAYHIQNVQNAYKQQPPNVQVSVSGGANIQNMAITLQMQG